MPLKIDKISSLPIVTNAEGTWLVTFNETTGKNERFKVSRLMVTGEYGDLLNIPPVPEPAVKLVTDMFTSNHPNGWFEARMSTSPITGKKVIELLARPDPTAAVDMVVTPDFGFGFGGDKSEYFPIPVTALDADGHPVLDANGDPTVKFFNIDIDPEGIPSGGTAPVQGSIVIPKDCPQAEVKYVVGAGSIINISYWIDNDGAYRRFHISDTPVANFAVQGDSVVIAGMTVPKSSVRKIYFGDSYYQTTELPDYFLFNFHLLDDVDLTPFTSVTQMGMTCFVNLNLGKFDISMMPLQSIGKYSISNIKCEEMKFDFSRVAELPESFTLMSRLKAIDISTFTSMTSVQDGFWGFYDLREINIGGIDWSLIDTNVNFAWISDPPAPAGVIYADTQALADAFMAKLTQGYLRDWTVVINS